MVKSQLAQELPEVDYANVEAYVDLTDEQALTLAQRHN